MTKRALLSVYDKTNLVAFAQGLTTLGWQLVASDGTANQLREAGLPVLGVAELTRWPEMLGGRVKTLHPAIHGGILARDTETDRADLAAQGIDLIDLVVCNLYPFQQTVARKDVTLAEAVEQIDIGGVTLLRAAAKNFARVVVVCDPADYEAVLAELQLGAVGETTRYRLALKAFAYTQAYDAAIVAYWQQQAAEVGTVTKPPALPDTLDLHLLQVQSLRYGENPHQPAALYATNPNSGPLGGILLQGKPLSYNNLLDLDAAWRTAAAFADPAVVIVKHLSPCGIATAVTPAAAFPAALASDPVSAFGGVIAVNRPVDRSFVAELEMAQLFIEAIVAPAFSDDARAWFSDHKKNCRLVALEGNDTVDWEIRTIRNGLLVQAWDAGDPAETTWRVVSRREPAEAEWVALRFAWKAVQHVKSNAIVLAAGTAAVGIGGGLPSRVDAVNLAVTKADAKAKGAVMASDAFFPFPDGLEVAATAGITAVIEPGGSIRDELVVETADCYDLALVFTGIRHFRH